MKIIEKLIRLWSINSEKLEQNSDTLHKATVFNFYSTITNILLFIFSIINVIQGNYLNFFIVSSVFIILIINHFHFKTKFQLKTSLTIYILAISIFFLWLIFAGNIYNQGILVFGFYPILTIILLGLKKGNQASLIFFPLSIIGLILPYLIETIFDFSLSNIILYTLIYAGSLIFINIYLKLIEQKQNKLIGEKNEAQKETLSKESFISKISHQIRTPLNNIVVVTNIVNNSNLDEKQRDLIDTIQASTNNLVNVVNNIAELSNVDILQSKDYNQFFNLETTITNTIKLFTDVDNNDISLPVNFQDKINYQLYGDPVKIKQIFLNLIENILKNSKSGQKKIQLDINSQNEQNNTIDIVFKISTHDFVHIPEITKIQNTIKSQKERNAALIKLLDLNIARRIIESIGGTFDINISSDLFKFEFIIEFKKGDLFSEEKDSQNESAIPEIKTDAKIKLSDANVLLVEDNLINQKIVLLSLKKAVKNVDIANNGKEALDKFGSVKYDVILMDIQMPIMNGIVTTKKIRNIEKSSNTHTPIIAITANALLGDKEECLAAGMDDYISKPFQIETLIKKIEMHLE
ncbi:MAG: response regulator [Bacteroidales bacterium]